ncbi:MAG: hypothetical protein SGARI_004847, partial [Bacillariaceae sp.]
MQPPPPATIALPVKPRDEDDEDSVEDYSNHVKPFDEPHVDDVQSDVSCGVDEPLLEPAAFSQSLLKEESAILTTSSSDHRIPSDEEQQPLMEVSIPSPVKTPKQQKESSSKSMKPRSATRTPVVVKETKTTTPETQASPETPPQGDFLEAYSHSGLEDADDVSTRLFDGDDLEGGKPTSYQKPIAKSEEGDLSDEDDDSKADSAAQRNH